VTRRSPDADQPFRALTWLFQGLWQVGANKVPFFLAIAWIRL